MKPFSKMEEGEEVHAIFSWCKKPWLMQAVDMGNGMGKEEVVQYKYYFRINLWFAVFWFSWLSKKKNI